MSAINKDLGGARLAKYKIRHSEGCRVPQYYILLFGGLLFLDKTMNKQDIFNRTINRPSSYNTNPSNPKELQPLWYEGKFDEFLNVLGFLN